MVEVSQAMVNDPQLGLVLLHLPVPHGPPIFDRASRQITALNLRKDWYFDNLLLADRVLGKIRDVMQRSGQWDTSALIVTSDHSLRPYMMAHPHATPLVPFMVKMPGQKAGTTFDQPFNAEITRDLIGAILNGKVTATNLSEWLRAHAASTPPESQVQ